MRSRQQKANALMDTIKACILAALAVGYLGILGGSNLAGGISYATWQGVLIGCAVYAPAITLIAYAFYYVARKKTY